MSALGVIAAAAILAVSAAPQAVAGDMATAPPLEGAPNHASELRADLGLDASAAVVARAAVDAEAYPDMTWGIPMSAAEAAEINRRIDVMHSVHPAVKAAEVDPSWGGWWIDQRDGGTPVLQFAADPSAKRASIARLLPATARVRVERVDVPMRDLKATQEEISKATDGLRADGIPITGVGVDTIGNRVVVSLEAVTEKAASTLRSRFGNVGVKQQGLAVADSCPATGCLPLKGGIGITDQNGNWPCTTGYMAKRTDTSPDKLVFVTAGHCVRFGTATDPWKHGSTNVGSSLSVGGAVHTWFDNSDADVGVVQVSYIPSTKNFVLVDESPVTIKHFEVQLSWDLQAPGQLVCRMGRTTGRQCGLIKDNDDTRESAVAGHGSMTIKHVVVYGRDANGGDSGGPMFYEWGDYAVLLGTHVHSQDGYVATGGTAWYSPVDRGIAQLQSSFPGLKLSVCLSSTCGGGF